MRAPLEALDRAVGRISRTLAIVGAMGIVVLGLILLADIVGRGLLGITVSGAKEIAANSVIGITMLVLPYTARTNSHIRTTVLLDHLPRRAQRTVLNLSDICGMSFFLLLAYASWEPMMRAWELGTYEGSPGSIRIPIAPTWTIIVLASALMALECLLAVWHRLAGRVDAGPDGAALPAVGAESVS